MKKYITIKLKPRLVKKKRKKLFEKNQPNNLACFASLA